MQPSDGVVAMDENANSLILSRENVSSWRIVSNEVTNLGFRNEATHVVFEVETTAALFPEMEEDIRKNGKSVLYLDAYRMSKEDFLPFNELEPLVIKEDVENVIGMYFKVCRNRMGITQTKLAQELQSYGICLTNGTINRWENGTLIPSAKQLAYMCSFFHVDIEKLLDAYHNQYYVSNAIDVVDRCYNLGLHHSFWNALEYDSFKHFLSDYLFFNLTKYKTSLVSGYCKIDEHEANISQILFTEQSIVLKSSDTTILELKRDNLQEVKPISLHMSTFYEFHGQVQNKSFSLFLLYGIIQSSE